MSTKYQALQDQIDVLTGHLEQTIRQTDGEDVLKILDQISDLSKAAGQGDKQALDTLITIFNLLSDDLVIPVARCFSHLLNFINTTEQHQLINHSLNQEDDDYQLRSFDSLLLRLKDKGFSFAQILPQLEKLFIEIVLTAHPTEATRRSIIQKHNALDECLRQLERKDSLSEEERNELNERLHSLILMTWVTDEVRPSRPTPVDEASWVMNTIENSLYNAVPKFIKSLNSSCKRIFGEGLPRDWQPLRISSWTGGDRDGNAFVTHKVTEEVIFNGRIRFGKLMIDALHQLARELTIRSADAKFVEKYGIPFEPYRNVLLNLRKRMKATVDYFEGAVAEIAQAEQQRQQQVKSTQVQEVNSANSGATGVHVNPTLEADLDIDLTNTFSKTYLRAQNKNLILSDEDLLEPLYDIYDSLIASNLKIIADGLLLDVIYRVRSFGVTLFRLDIRQESSRHEKAIAELVEYYGYGDYYSWSEEQRIEFLERELKSRRPLLSKYWRPSSETAEVLATTKLIAQQPKGVINCYIISMAKDVSDILEVKLLLKLYDDPSNLMVCPLFETLEDLTNAPKVMERLFTNDWYFNKIAGKQMIMVGYSDSAKDAGFFAAGWAQYLAQENLVALCDKYDIDLTLFHGRGGTIGRGGSPAHAALLSQPPGSLENGLRVTEQGEMIRFKFGLPEIAKLSLDLYASAILESNILPPVEPKDEWRQVMDELSEYSCESYRAVVFKEPLFIPYFRQATPEVELSTLNLGSRAAKRNVNGGVESLRAIPWIFAWTQNRLLLPTWLGTGEALEKCYESGHKEKIIEMLHQWPFFSTRIGMLEMVFTKVNIDISKMYEQKLVSAPELHQLGSTLRARAEYTKNVILGLHGDNQGHMMQDSPWIYASIVKRNTYTLPLHLLQIELLKRSRLTKQNNPLINKALQITITGVAAGMRNTG